MLLAGSLLVDFVLDIFFDLGGVLGLDVAYRGSPRRPND